MDISHAAHSEQCICSSKMTGLDSSRRHCKMLVGRRQFERRKNGKIFGFGIHGFQDYRGGEAFRGFALQGISSVPML